MKNIRTFIAAIVLVMTVAFFSGTSVMANHIGTFNGYVDCGAGAVVGSVQVIDPSSNVNLTIRANGSKIYGPTQVTHNAVSFSVPADDGDVVVIKASLSDGDSQSKTFTVDCPTPTIVPPTATTVPTLVPTSEPTDEPTATSEPTNTPTTEPTATDIPTEAPTDVPTTIATVVPTSTDVPPTDVPTSTTTPPTVVPTITNEPTYVVPTDVPTNTPIVTETVVTVPTEEPTFIVETPVTLPTDAPTIVSPTEPVNATPIVETPTEVVGETKTPTSVVVPNDGENPTSGSSGPSAPIVEGLPNTGQGVSQSTNAIVTLTLAALAIMTLGGYTYFKRKS